jgi:hypothetical protein
MGHKTATRLKRTGVKALKRAREERQKALDRKFGTAKPILTTVKDVPVSSKPAATATAFRRPPPVVIGGVAGYLGRALRRSAVPPGGEKGTLIMAP